MTFQGPFQPYFFIVSLSFCNCNIFKNSKEEIWMHSYYYSYSKYDWSRHAIVIYCRGTWILLLGNAWRGKTAYMVEGLKMDYCTALIQSLLLRTFILHRAYLPLCFSTEQSFASYIVVAFYGPNQLKANYASYCRNIKENLLCKEWELKSEKCRKFPRAISGTRH